MSRTILLACAAMSIGAGCTDARARYDEYGSRLVDASTVEVDAPIVSEIADVTGEFLVTARAPLTEDRFFSFVGTVVYTPVTANTGTFEFALQPLDHMTLEPVGEVIDGDDVDVNEAAQYDWPLIGLIPAGANSVTGSNAPINSVVHGTIIHVDFFCGTLTGTAGSLNLAGSFFGAVRITGDTLPTAVHRCEDAPPAP